MLRQAFIAVPVFFSSIINAQSIAVAVQGLAQQYNISCFNDYLQQNQDLIGLLDDGVHTGLSHISGPANLANSPSVLVPTDAAIEAAQSLMPAAFNDSNSIRALLQYHILLDTHPAQSFSNSSNLVPTLLQDTSYANVTGGQRVELSLKDGQPTFLSAIKAESKIVRPDNFFKGGLLHIIDSVLQIPLSFPDTITKANLPYLVALLNEGNWLAPNSIANKLALETPDLTFIGPNDPKYGAGFDGFNGLTQAQLDDIFLYHVIPRLVYTTDMANNTEYQTMANLSLVARQFVADQGLESARFLDQAQITTSNYITANGVLHIVDRPLDPKQAGSGPSQSDVNKALNIVSTLAKRKLSISAIAGIVACLVVVLIALAVGLVILTRRSKQNLANGFQRSGQINSHGLRQRVAAIIAQIKGHPDARRSVDNRSLQSFSTAKEPCELDGKHPYHQVYEMGGSDQTPPRWKYDHIVEAPALNFNKQAFPKMPPKAMSHSSGSVPEGYI